MAHFEPDMSPDHSTHSLLQSEWWLDAVAPGQWHKAEVRTGGDVRAWMPYVLRKRGPGLRIIAMPPLTQALGPWLAPSDAGHARQLALEKDLMFSLIEQLPPFDHFEQSWHHSITNWLPFLWKGFSQTTRYTYIIEHPDEPDRIWSDLQPNIRKDIRKAEKSVAVRSDLGVDVLWDLNEKTFRRQGSNVPYSRDLVLRLDNACEKHDARRMFFAEDAQGRVHAALYVVWDNRAARGLISGADPELRHSGAGSLVMWEAIKFAAGVAATFDFGGSVMESVERYFRAFGAVQKPYFHIFKTNSRLLKTRNFIRELLK